MNSTVTLRDVAKEAGVSLGTVSRVLNRKYDVAPEFAKRVVDTVKKLNYKPNLGSVGLQRSVASFAGATGFKTYTIGFIQHGMTRDEYVNDKYQQRLFSAVEREVSDRNLHFIFSTYSTQKNKKLPLMVHDRKVDGVLIKTSEWQQSNWIDAVAATVPVVLVSNRLDRDDIPSVNMDNIGISRQVIQYLLRLGHRRIGFFQVQHDVNSPKGLSYDSFSQENKLFAYREVVKKMSLINIPEYAQTPIRDWTQQSLVDVAGDAIDAWVSMGTERPTAIHCGADVYALALIEAAKKRGLSIPDDLSVVGGMNTDECELSDPPLTSIEYHPAESSRLILDMMCQRIEHPEHPPWHATLMGELIERGSCMRIDVN